MGKLVTLAVFNHAIEVKYNLLKGMLDEAGIQYLSYNENVRKVEPLPFITPTNMAIAIKVYEEDYEAALEILNAIQ